MLFFQVNSNHGPRARPPTMVRPAGRVRHPPGGALPRGLPRQDAHPARGGAHNGHPGRWGPRAIAVEPALRPLPDRVRPRDDALPRPRPRRHGPPRSACDDIQSLPPVHQEPAIYHPPNTQLDESKDGRRPAPAPGRVLPLRIRRRFYRQNMCARRPLSKACISSVARI